MSQLLLFSDVHNDHAACERLVEQAAEADLVLGAGDFCTMRRGLSETLDRLAAIETPTVVVPGNSESVEELRAAVDEAGWAAATVLHGNGATVNGHAVFGIGGGIPVTPFGDWSYDFTEEEATDLLRDCPEGAMLVSHSPPHNVVDQDSSGQHLGSQAVRETIERTHPRLVACGHIHGSWGETDTLSGTPVINAGPQGVMWTLSTG
jgi:Icc-related predicted phosphoesterase